MCNVYGETIYYVRREIPAENIHRCRKEFDPIQTTARTTNIILFPLGILIQ